jgi:hypothetical protein
MVVREAGRDFGAFIFTMALLSLPLAAQSAGTGPAAKQQESTPPKVHDFLDILADPSVQTWLARQGVGSSAEPAPASEEATVASHFAGRVAAIRERMAARATARPQLPAEFERAGVTLFAELQNRGLIEVSLLLVGFVALGFGAEWLIWRPRSCAGCAKTRSSISCDTRCGTGLPRCSGESRPDSNLTRLCSLAAIIADDIDNQERGCGEIGLIESTAGEMP